MPNTRNNLTQAALKKIIRYDPATGNFTWLANVAIRAPAGSTAGWICKKGYRRISIKNTDYQAGRLAWLYMTGSWPENDIDHKNHNAGDNRWNNLRDVPRADNSQNFDMNKKRRSAMLVGVTREWNKFRARIRVDGKTKNLGVFDTAEGAHEAYIAAKLKHHKSWVP